MEEKIITFCVPCYNSASYMRKAIDSLIKPFAKEVEIIIVDDGSKDDTGKIADEYGDKYPDLIKVIHEENGGHGEGINNSIKLASGKYFKVIDSDDWVDETGYKMILEALRNNPDVDLFISDYSYYVDGVKDKTINYKIAMPANRVITWKNVHKFLYQQNLTLHSCTYRTELFRQINLKLPKKVSYEDNYMIYAPLKLVKKLYYLDHDFYCYFIGREGQSITKSICMKKYKDHLLIAKLMDEEFDVFDYKKDRHLFRILMHHLKLVNSIAFIYTRLNKNKEAHKAYKDFIIELKSKNKRLYRYFKYHSYVGMFMLPSVFGGWINSTIMINLAHQVVPFY